MTVAATALLVWFGLTALLGAVPMILGVTRIRLAAGNDPNPGGTSSVSPCEVLVPVKGALPHQENILESLLTQTHPMYKVVFIVESENDPANPVLDRLCGRHPHARKIISGVSLQCCRKNHNLIKGVESIEPVTRIIVFCDSSNVADRDWLLNFTEPIESGETQVVTTFRAFNPRPDTLGGVCQAIYAAFLLAIIQNLPKPKPWGGATAIRRDTFERLNVVDTWAFTVVDDLVLGDILDRAGVPVKFNAHCLLGSPLHNQTVSGFLSYLDRQVLFPKFTHPWIWATALVYHVNLPVTLAVATVAGLGLYPIGAAGTPTAAVSLGYLAVGVLAGTLLRIINPFGISILKWLLSFFPCILFVGFIFLRSIFRNYVVWNGTKYLAGRNGRVLAVIDDF